MVAAHVQVEFPERGKYTNGADGRIGGTVWPSGESSEKPLHGNLVPYPQVQIFAPSPPQNRTSLIAKKRPAPDPLSAKDAAAFLTSSWDISSGVSRPSTLVPCAPPSLRVEHAPGRSGLELTVTGFANEAEFLGDQIFAKLVIPLGGQSSLNFSTKCSSRNNRCSPG